jgi:ADP-dependent NAD(P)H-hydrate dehydratase / NAD(P)H-hydrate epimerase
MWYIAGTVPELDCALELGLCQVQGQSLVLPSGKQVPIARGTPTLVAATLLACAALGIAAPAVVLAADKGKGDGSRLVYKHLSEHAAAMQPQGITFHYLFPDVDWHNRVLLAMQALPTAPLLVADAGFMYVAKMSGYADAYTVFTPDKGELAFLADERAPHPFYTRGFLLEADDDVPALYARAKKHGNCPANLLIKGSVDYIVAAGSIVAQVSEPSVPAMEAIGGTGDLVTALVTTFLMQGRGLQSALLAAARTNRLLAAHVQPTPATQVGELVQALPAVLALQQKSIFA